MGTLTDRIVLSRRHTLAGSAAATALAPTASLAPPRVGMHHRFVLQQVTAPIVPNFFLLDGRTILKSAVGVGGWRHQILPMIPGMLSGEWFRGRDLG